MISVILLCVCVSFASSAHDKIFRHSTPARYKPNSEEINIADVTFTTPPSDTDYFPTNNLNYYNKKPEPGIRKPGLIVQNDAYGSEPERSPNLFSTSPIRFVNEPETYKTAIAAKPSSAYKYKAPEEPVNRYRPIANKLRNEQYKQDGFKASVPETTTPIPNIRNEVYGTVVGAPPDILKQYSNKVINYPNQGQLSNNYYQPQRQKNYIPVTASSSGGNFFGGEPLSITNDDYSQFEKITESPQRPLNFITKETPQSTYKVPQRQLDYNPKEYYPKPVKKPQYPKKYSASNLKNKGKLHSKLRAKAVKPVKPVEEISEPVRESYTKKAYYKESQEQSPTFSAGLSAFHEPISHHEISSGFADPSPASIRGSDFARFTDSAPLKGGDGDRVEFQMYGMDGPHSYKFGYDTGKGYNRHFRFEERDSNGKVKGHYGYMDKDGKMRVMKYEADPHTGFHAGPMDYPPNDFS